MMDDLLQEMIDPAPPQRDRPRRRRMWTTVGIVGLAVVGATSLTTSALFSDTDSTSAEISTGTVDLAVGPVDFALPDEGMEPGDTVYTPVVVRNDGSLQLRYAIEYRATPATSAAPSPTLAAPDGQPVAAASASLATIVRLSVYRAPSCDAAGVAGAELLGRVTGTDAAPLEGDFTAIVGSPATGPQAGDRPLPAATDETLCVEVHLPLEAGNQFQGTGLALALRMQAEQVANNGAAAPAS
ncbi:TasA family protein [Cellulomonas biazotea]|uniref:Uncharacterized protein n=1 Tax=Cellulomonas biazotea TaxID=1709 RepID=A0A402DM85_9CELL|nr:TasA family protein [Cellulomonas biazotea]GCE75237.1 hypothetical protein CBZ_02930 [Cellulomonas biazotea]